MRQVKGMQRIYLVVFFLLLINEFINVRLFFYYVLIDWFNKGMDQFVLVCLVYLFLVFSDDGFLSKLNKNLLQWFIFVCIRYNDDYS